MKKIIYSFILLLVVINFSGSQTWVQKLSGVSMWSLAKDIQGNLYAGASGTVKNIYKSTDGGDTWNTILQSGASNFLSISVDSAGNIFAANVANGLMKSTNGGNNWLNIPVSTFNGNSVEAVLCGKSGYVYVGTIGGGIYRSTDNGSTFPDTALSSITCVTLVVDRYNSNIIYAGASATTGLLGFFRSTNSGTSYGGPYNTNTCWGVVQKSQTELYMITTTTGYPFSKSTDGGLNWSTISNQPGAMRGVTIDAIGNIYICGNGGVHKSTNNGLTFTNHNLTYSGNQVISHQNKIFAAITGTTNGGVWMYYDSGLVNITPIIQGIPESFSLHQNFPNPFNPATKIIYDLPKSTFVKLVVYDILGNVVQILVDENQQIGSYKAEWDGTNFASGVYFYQLQTDGYFETKRMVLIK